MKNIKLIYALVFLLGLGISISAAAHGGGHSHHGGDHHHGTHFGVVIGGPLWWPGPGYYSPYYGPYYGYPYAPVVTVPAEPSVYIEQPQVSSLSSSTASSNYWYYCSDPDGYYPYVKQCAGGWQKVPPNPPPH